MAFSKLFEAHLRHLSTIKLTTMAKVKKSIIDLYMNWVLEKGGAPENVYLFAKENKMTEAEFYAEFGSIKAIEKQVFAEFFKKTLELLEANEAYMAYQPQEKLLSFYFTFFEMLTANRSYVMAALPSDFKSLDKLEQLKSLRTHFLTYAEEIFAPQIKTDIEKLQKIKSRSFKEAAWAQLLLTMRFWMKDESAGFEKTDIFIEKSIKATFDLVDTTPLNSVIDLGKFLFKEAMA